MVKNPVSSGGVGSIPEPLAGSSPGEGNGSPLQCSPVDKGACWATVHRVTKRRLCSQDVSKQPAC